jgi:hypothetical protein
MPANKRVATARSGVGDPGWDPTRVGPVSMRVTGRVVEWPEMTPTYDELRGIQTAWFAEVRRVLETKSAWSYLGSIEIEAPSLRYTMGGFIDRKEVPMVGADPSSALEAWRRTAEGRITDTLVTKINSAMLQRLPPARQIVRESEPWADDFGPKNVVLLGRSGDLLKTLRRVRAHDGGERFHACSAETPEGTVVAVSGGSPSCRALVSVALTPEPNAVAVVLALEVRSLGTTALKRIDLVA